LRIAEIASVFFPVPPASYGGSELVVSLLTEGLVARGHDVVLFATGDSRTSGRLVSALDEHTGLAGPTAQRDELYHKAYAYLHLDGVEVVHDHGWLGASLAAVHRFDPPVVHTLHHAWSERTRRDHALIGDRLHRVAVSRSQAGENPAVEYAAVIHNGIEVERFPLVRDKDEYLVFVGRASDEKAPHLAVELAKAVGRTLVLVVKRDEPREREYWAREVEPRLAGTEVVVDAPAPGRRIELVSRAAALVFPIQWSEPFGLVQTEAMACGTPVVGLARGAVPEIVDDGVTGFVCEDLDEMAAAVERLGALSPDACRRHVEDRFSAARMVERYERLFGRLVG
jgi:glycosyltransferase involved in cell wall biosynthesis